MPVKKAASEEGNAEKLLTRVLPVYNTLRRNVVAVALITDDVS